MATEILEVAVVVVIVCESGKAAAVEVEGEWIVAGAKDVNSHVELPSSEEEGVENVPLADIVFWVDVFIGSFPATDISDFVEDKNAFALAFRGLLHATSTGFMIHKILSLF